MEQAPVGTVSPVANHIDPFASEATAIDFLCAESKKNVPSHLTEPRWNPRPLAAQERKQGSTTTIVSKQAEEAEPTGCRLSVPAKSPPGRRTRATSRSKRSCFATDGTWWSMRPPRQTVRRDIAIASSHITQTLAEPTAKLLLQPVVRLDTGQTSYAGMQQISRAPGPRSQPDLSGQGRRVLTLFGPARPSCLWRCSARRRRRGLSPAHAGALVTPIFLSSLLCTGVVLKTQCSAAIKLSRRQQCLALANPTPYSSAETTFSTIVTRSIV